MKESQYQCFFFFFLPAFFFFFPFQILVLLIGKLLMKTYNLELAEIATKCDCQICLANPLLVLNLSIDAATESKMHFKF